MEMTLIAVLPRFAATEPLLWWNISLTHSVCTLLAHRLPSGYHLEYPKKREAAVFPGNCETPLRWVDLVVVKPLINQGAGKISPLPVEHSSKDLNKDSNESLIVSKFFASDVNAALG
ncbi:hypothetical protein TNIN_210941 [Trichonephila inaurata madagascariensis]|uniref:Uncharacterized protein n=1 Tax=Trichonephila inaurata madagascariensis TaxID=2747483 RepID=A0A8X7CNF2_9ARAC|nr:hypothetical protein TNIN_210941 [Trichonephila inaurata madagascariensis]